MKKYKELRIEIALLGTAFFVLIVSVLKSYIELDYTWFGRSGSIMALNAIIVEYRLNNVQLKRFNRKSKQATFSGFPTNALPTKENQNIGKIAHVFIISGTIIWGYGDLINELIK